MASRVAGKSKYQLTSWCPFTEILAVNLFLLFLIRKYDWQWPHLNIPEPWRYLFCCSWNSCNTRTCPRFECYHTRLLSSEIAWWLLLSFLQTAVVCCPLFSWKPCHWLKIGTSVQDTVWHGCFQFGNIVHFQQLRFAHSELLWGYYQIRQQSSPPV